jgi:tripartite ATP-independent transporter DctM subunit
VSPAAIGVIGIGVMILLLFLEVHIGVAMGLVGLAGFAYLSDIQQGLSLLGMLTYSNIASYDFIVLPLFVAMGTFASVSGMARELYDAAYKWMGAFRGGLAIATVAACAGFSAVSGTSVGTAATVGAIALPEMKKHKYNDSLATGVVAAGGTLGILIPPSTIFVFYGILTETSVGKLLIAGIFPGILLASLFILAIILQTRRNPDLAPPSQGATLKEKLKAAKNVWATLLLFLVVIGGLWVGIFTPTEAGGIGAFGALVLGMVKRKLNRQTLGMAIMETMKTTGMIIFMLVCAFMFNGFMAVSRLPVELANLLAGLAVNRYIVFLGIVTIYFIFGCLMDSFSMLILTIPIFFPLITTLGFDPIWFGVIVVIMMEQALITPPVGLNVFIIRGMARDVPMISIFQGIVPFWVAMMLCVAILTIFPQIALFLGGLGIM